MWVLSKLEKLFVAVEQLFLHINSYSLLLPTYLWRLQPIDVNEKTYLLFCVEIIMIMHLESYNKEFSVTETHGPQRC